VAIFQNGGFFRDKGDTGDKIWIRVKTGQTTALGFGYNTSH
jgi:hypothetical protein